MTRGRDGNDVWVVTDPASPADAVDLLAEVMERRWSDEPAISSIEVEAADTGIGL